MEKRCKNYGYLLVCASLYTSLLLILISYAPLISAKNGDALIEPQTLYSQLASHSNFIIVDVRPIKKYNLGHIKGAINVPIDKTYRQINMAKKVAAIPIIQTLFGNAGISNDSSIVLYDGSWLEWANDSELPIEPTN